MMTYLLFFYSLVLLLAMVVQWRQSKAWGDPAVEQTPAPPVLVLVAVCALFVVSIALFWLDDLLLKVFAGFCLFSVSSALFLDRVKSGLPIHYSHHLIRILWHVFLAVGLIYL